MCGALINISGKTNSGKTTLALTIAKNAAHQGFLLTIFDDADHMGETLEPLVKKLLEQGTHVVTITHGTSDNPVVSITGQPDAFLMRALFGDGLVGVKVFAKSDCGNLADASPEEAETILSNTSRRASFLGFRDADWQSAPGKSESSRSRSHSFRDPGTRLLEAGYVPGMEYRHALEMGKWHPDMERFLADLPGGAGTNLHMEGFGQAKTLAALKLACNEGKPSGDSSSCCGHRSAEPSTTATDSDGARFHTFVLGTTRAGKRSVPFATGLFLHGEDALKHSICLGRSADGMSYPNRAVSQDMHNFLKVKEFTQDLHELLVKHAGVVNAPTARGDDVQIAVSRKVVEMLPQHGDTSSYINNLRRFDVNQRS